MNQNKTRVAAEPPRTLPVLLGGRCVGHVVGDTLNKSIEGSRHMLKKPRAIAFDESVILFAEQHGAEHIKVYDRDTRSAYDVSIAEFRQHCFRLDRGFGTQLALTLDYWGLNGQRSAYQEKAEQEKEKERTSHTQLALFGE